MPTWKLEIEYEGTRYRGWRMEHNQKTVQDEMLFVTRRLFSSKAEIVGAEDTEVGVHARSNVAHLKVAELKEDLTPRQILNGFNEFIPYDINILKVRNADEDFHARNDISLRQYLYQISTRRTAFAKNFVWWNKEEPNVLEMQKAAELLKGKHDFQSFCEFDEESKRNSPVIFCENAEVFVDDYLVCIRIAARRFLPKMMQRLVGTLAEVGRGNLEVKDFERMLKFRSNAPTKYNAPPSGLFLEKVIYKGDV
jgi:tRNA pseudouridine38-40 synthase